ncbi:MAG TPA: PDZ domain-containing protein [Pirellulaceae bacterium]|nr:PDZ domain-containing protein [Pirellulaceae bacterium]
MRWDTLIPLFLAVLAATAAGQETLDDLEEQALRSAVDVVAPSVVQIETVGGLERVGKLLVGTGPTTGLVVSEDGLIVSSAFNFVQKPTSILVTLPSGKRAAAQIVARDHSRMLVLLKVNTTEKLAVPSAVPREEMQVGQWAIAVGRTLSKSEPNFSVRIVSALDRIWGKAIQTDAKISPVNYGGPLIDIRGRVLGVLVPLTPQQPQGAEQQASEIAGAEWYDSGIGFAVPLADINARLETLKEGKDLHPGVLGVALKKGDMFSLPAEIVGARADGPAGKAGLKAGDVIVEVDGMPIDRQTQLRHALGRRYAGDKVKVVVRRGTDRVEAEVPLVEKLAPYQHPFLGILPLRIPGAGVSVRFVYPESPAAKAGIQAGDKIVAANQAPVAGRLEMIDQVALLEPGKVVSLSIERGSEKLSIDLTPAKLPTDIPPELPAAQPEPAKAADPKPAAGLVEIKLPEEKNACVAFVPETYHPDVPHGVVIWLHGAGGLQRDALTTRWKDACEKHHFIVLAPQASNPAKWEPTDDALVIKTLDDLLSHYNVDRSRIAVYGYQTAGSMAFLVGLNHLDRVRAVVAVDAAPPARTVLPENDPLIRLAFFLGTAEKSPAAAGAKAVGQRLQAGLYPVLLKSLGEQSRDLTEAEIADLIRWLDSLDRI